MSVIGCAIIKKNSRQINVFRKFSQAAILIAVQFCENLNGIRRFYKFLRQCFDKKKKVTKYAIDCASKAIARDDQSGPLPNKNQ
jgi:hypothetical protein